MNKKVSALVLTGALACALTVPAFAAEVSAVPISAPVSAEEIAVLPDSVLYYGTVKEIGENADGTMTWLRMTSDRYGEYVMNLSADTVWIDNGKHTASDPTNLKEGERLYVFHSAVETRSLPPQSAAFAVVRNIPMDVGCAWYHEVESVALENGQLIITTDNGSLLISADEKTQLSRYEGEGAVSLKDIQAGDRVMAWYGAVTDSLPGQTHATSLMLLPEQNAAQEREDNDAVARGELAVMLYEQAGKPEVISDGIYTDVDADSHYFQAIRWVTSQGLMSGYGDGSFGPEDTLTREQLTVILWRYAGSPMLMDYPGLTQYSDAGEISRFAQSAMAWAHQKGYISAEANGLLNPQGAATQEMVEAALSSLK